MKKSTAAWLITAASLILLGLVIFGSMMTVMNWDFTNLNTVKYITSTYEADQDFNNISIKADTDDIIFLPSEDGKCKIVCYEQEKIKHSVNLENETLIITKEDTRKWYEHISIMSVSTPTVTVYLPKAEYASLLITSSTGDVEIPENFKFESIDISLSTGDVFCRASASGDIKIKASTGDISIENISSQNLDLSVTTGKINASSINCGGSFHIYVSTGDAKLTDVACRSLTSGGNTGRLSLTNVIAEESFNIKRSTGDVRLDACDAHEIFIKTDTGSVRGSLLSEKVFITKTDTGRVNVPQTATGGRCEIITDTGDIDINIK